MVLIDHCHSLILAKDGEDYTEAACTDAYLQLGRQLPTELRIKIYAYFNCYTKISKARIVAS